MQHDDADVDDNPKVTTEAYIVKADVLDVRTPQKIQIFRRKIF